jgi:hypothetical protein
MGRNWVEQRLGDKWEVSLDTADPQILPSSLDLFQT